MKREHNCDEKPEKAFVSFFDCGTGPKWHCGYAGHIIRKEDVLEPPTCPFCGVALE